MNTKRILSIFCLLLAILSGNCKVKDEVGPPPVLLTLSPTTALARMYGFTLTVTGSNFSEEAVIVFNNIEKVTNFINSGKLTCDISPNDTIVDGTADPEIINVIVRNPGYFSPNNTDSDSLGFTLQMNPGFKSAQKIQPTASANLLDVLVDQQERVYLIWSDEDGMFFIRSNDKGDNWEDRTTITGRQTSWASCKTIGNRLFIAWSYNNDVYFVRSSNNGSSWSTPVTINDESISPWHVYIDGLKSGKIGVTWGERIDDSDFVFFSYSMDYGNTWSSTTMIGDGRFPRVNIDDEKNFNLIWDYNDDYHGWGIYFSRSTDNGSSWNEAKRIADGIDPEIRTDKAGYLNVLYGSSGLQFTQSMNKGQNWSAPVTVGSDVEDHAPDLGIDGIGNLHVSWAADIEAGKPAYKIRDTIYYSRSINDGKSWTPQVKLSIKTDYISWLGPKIAVDSAGTVYVVWASATDQESESSFYFTRSTD